MRCTLTFASTANAVDPCIVELWHSCLRPLDTRWDPCIHVRQHVFRDVTLELEIGQAGYICHGNWQTLLLVLLTQRQEPLASSTSTAQASTTKAALVK